MRRLTTDVRQARIQVIQAEQAEQIARASLAQWLGVLPGEVQIASGPLLEMPPGAGAGTSAAVTHPLAESQMANVESRRAFQHRLARSYFPRLLGDVEAPPRSGMGTSMRAVVRTSPSDVPFGTASALCGMDDTGGIRPAGW